jgi:hypothetical protein
VGRTGVLLFFSFFDKNLVDRFCLMWTQTEYWNSSKNPDPRQISRQNFKEPERIKPVNCTVVGT